jgi:hypothetical protein
LRIRPATGVFAFHCPNGGARRPIEAAILKGLGVVAGVPDVIAIRDGRTYALELKAPGGKLTENQRATHSAMTRAGAQVAVADNLDDALDLLGLGVTTGDDDVKLCLTGHAACGGAHKQN